MQITPEYNNNIRLYVHGESSGTSLGGTYVKNRHLPSGA